jgi:alkanesulfonate monooxygenase SsuD/methylene tetrahydromethanopterin reductase-like flavin-dependent oxidoreductase (luciferase family)
VHEDRDLARSWYRRYLASFYLALPHYQQLFAANGFPEAVEEIKERLADGDADGAAAAIPDPAVDELALAGTPAECVERLPAFFARGLDAAKLYPIPIGDDWAAAYLATVDLFRTR